MVMEVVETGHLLQFMLMDLTVLVPLNMPVLLLLSHILIVPPEPLVELVNLETTGITTVTIMLLLLHKPQFLFHHTTQ